MLMGQSETLSASPSPALWEDRDLHFTSVSGELLCGFPIVCAMRPDKPRETDLVFDDLCVSPFLPDYIPAPIGACEPNRIYLVSGVAKLARSHREIVLDEAFYADSFKALDLLENDFRMLGVVAKPMADPMSAMFSFDPTTATGFTLKRTEGVATKELLWADVGATLTGFDGYFSSLARGEFRPPIFSAVLKDEPRQVGKTPRVYYPADFYFNLVIRVMCLPFDQQLKKLSESDCWSAYGVDLTHGGTERMFRRLKNRTSDAVSDGDAVNWDSSLKAVFEILAYQLRRRFTTANAMISSDKLDLLFANVSRLSTFNFIAILELGLIILACGGERSGKADTTTANILINCIIYKMVLIDHYRNLPPWAISMAFAPAKFYGDDAIWGRGRFVNLSLDQIIRGYARFGIEFEGANDNAPVTKVSFLGVQPQEAPQGWNVPGSFIATPLSKWRATVNIVGGGMQPMEILTHYIAFSVLATTDEALRRYALLCVGAQLDRMGANNALRKWAEVATSFQVMVTQHQG